jgi:DNA-directed RNA polymerase specialized sigma24 family protein
VSIKLEDLAAAEPLSDERLLELDIALDRFQSEEPEKAQVVHLRFFAGLSEERAADALGISRATAARYWKYARAWLFDAVERGIREDARRENEIPPPA